jgi:acyl-CoA synthetase (NDP forming)
VEALFHQAGVIRATNLEELLDVAALSAACAEPRGRRVAVLTNAGGLGILCADACEAAGLELAPLKAETVAALTTSLPAEASLHNPIDMLGSATAASYEAALAPVLADEGIDAVIVLFVPAAAVDPEAVAEALVRGRSRSRNVKPVLSVVMTAAGTPDAFRDATGIASFAYPETAARALGRAAQRADWLRRPIGSIPVTDGIDHEAGRRLVTRVLERSGEDWLAPSETRDLFAAYGIPLVGERFADSVEAAVLAANDLGYPVAVKTATAGVHKTEIRGVELDLRDGAMVRAAAARIGPPLLVQPMVHGGVELLAGLVQDPVFGPLVAFGPGGRFAELLGEAGFRIAPLTDVDAEELVHEGKAGRLVRGFRGLPAVDVAALADVLHRLSRLGEELPEVAELDLNPLLAFPDRCMAVDARVRVRWPAERETAKTW